MKKGLKRIRGAIGMGLTWAVAGGVAGTIINLGFLVRTGSRPDAPFPIMLGAFGFVAGVIFSGALRLVEGRRRFDQMSLPRFAAWGAAVGFALSATFFLAVARGDPAFLRYLAVVGPVVAAAAAACAAGSLALARRAQDREVLEAAENGPAVARPEGEARKPLRNGR
jgi:peptidoglycan/LPS O-acetylase OafA/YrhL